jgi:anti-anti-sigma factor
MTYDPSDTFRVTVTCHDARWGLQVRGELDVCTGCQLIEVGAAIGSEAGGSVEMDLSGVEFIDISGLRAVGRACQAIRSGGGQVVITGASSPAVRRLVDALVPLGLDRRSRRGAAHPARGVSTRARGGADFFPGTDRRMTRMGAVVSAVPT